VILRRRSTAVKGLAAADLADRDLDALFLVWLVGRSTEDLLGQALAPLGLTADELAVYSVLAAVPSISPTELARWMAAPQTTVSSYVKRLTTRGHVVRQDDPHDRRSYRLALSRSGREVHHRAVALVSPVRDRVTAALGDQDADVRGSLNRLRVVLDTERAGGRGPR
jgi:DNA-binding MarR family transcriptional regulator